MSAVTGKAAPARPRDPVLGHPGRLALVVLLGGPAAALLLLPLAAVFALALQSGLDAYLAHLAAPDTRHAIGLTLLAAAVAVPVNTVFGLAAAWAVAKHEFPGRKLLISLIELPLSISPIVIGVAYLFVFGMQGLLGPWLSEHGVRLVFSVPAVVIVTTIITVPYVFREILPLMQSQGATDEHAAVSLGASGWKTFLRVTLPNIRWALFYGVCLCFARSLGEFGTVAVVSGAIRGETNTMTLQIELLANDRDGSGAFALASVLSFIALVTLALKLWFERREAAQS
jgi:sulfate transport system permease protein